MQTTLFRKKVVALATKILPYRKKSKKNEKDIDFEKWIWYYNKCKNKPKKKY